MYAHEYDAAVIRVIDGDTIALDIDLGFYVHVKMSCRLVGINARELHSPGGEPARLHLESLAPPGTQVLINTVKSDKFAGRFDAIVVSPATRPNSVNNQMVKDGYAVIWDGKGEAPVPRWPIQEG